MTQVDPVILQLKADIADYQADLTKAQRHADTKLDAIEKKGFAMGQNLKKGFDMAKGAAIAFVGAIVIDKMVQAVTQGLEYASSLGEVAQQLGVTTDALQEYRFAATQVGLSQEEMDQALAQLTRRAGEAANGTKAQAAAFEKLGVSVTDANGAMVPTGDLIPKIADAMLKIENPAQRAAILMDLFGKSGQKLEPLLSEGSRGIEEFKRRAHELGIVLESSLIRQADEAADRVSELKQQLNVNISAAVARNANAILGLANAIATLTSNSIQFIANYPRLTGALAGAAIGARLGGGPGAAIGGGLGVIGGQVAANERENSIDDLEFRRKRQAAALAEVNRQLSGKGKKGGLFTVYQGAETGSLESATKNLQRENDLLRQATAKKQAVQAMAALGAVPLASSAGGGGAGAKGAGAGGGGASGPSAAEIQHQLDNELAGYAMQAISAMQAIATSADERADLELRALELAHKRDIAEIKSNKDYFDAKSKEFTANGERLRLQAEATAERERERIEFRRKAENERNAADIAEAQYRIQADDLRSQLDLSENRKERRQLAFDLLDLEYRYQKSLLETVIASETATAVEKERARIALQGLTASQGARKASAARDFASPGERYLSDLARDAENINDAYENIAANGLRSLNDGITEAIMGSKSLGDVFKNVANQIIADLVRIAVQQAITIPLANALFGGGGGGGGLFGNLLGAIPFFASGTSSAPPGLAVVGEKGPELVRFRGGEQVIPNHAIGNMSVAGGGGTVVQRFHLDARGAVMTQDIVNQINAMGQQAAEAGARGGHALASRDIANMRRPKL